MGSPSHPHKPCKGGLTTIPIPFTDSKQPVPLTTALPHRLPCPSLPVQALPPGPTQRRPSLQHSAPTCHKPSQLGGRAHSPPQPSPEWEKGT